MNRRGPMFALLIACGNPSTTPDDAGTPDASHDVQTEGGSVDAIADVTSESDGADAFKCGTITPTGSTATAYHINAHHDGVQPSDNVAVPLCKRWTVPFAGPISYPVVAGGRVFVSVADVDAGPGSNVYALDEKTGSLVWGPFALVTTWSGLTYDAGKLFVLDGRGMMYALDPTTGNTIWQSKSSAMSVTYPPVAWGGRVFYTAGPLFGVDQFDGTIAWTTKALGSSSPAVDSGGVYVSLDCDTTYSFDPSTGGSNWYHAGLCQYGGGNIAALHAGTLFVRGAPQTTAGSLMIIASSGASIDYYYWPSAPIPIPTFFGTNEVFIVANGELVAKQLNPVSQLWSFAGDAALVTAPIVAGSNVVVGSSSGTIYLVDPTMGTLVTSDDVGAPLEPSNEGSNVPLNGLAVADGMLFVPAKGMLVAY